jgi:hypothetical protein
LNCEETSLFDSAHPYSLSHTYGQCIFFANLPFHENERLGLVDPVNGLQPIAHLRNVLSPFDFVPHVFPMDPYPEKRGYPKLARLGAGSAPSLLDGRQ